MKRRFLTVAAIVGLIASRLKPEIALKNLIFLMDLSRQNGITTTSDLAFGAIDLRMEDKLGDTHFNNPDSPMRCVVVTDSASVLGAKGNQAIAFVQDLAHRRQSMRSTA